VWSLAWVPPTPKRTEELERRRASCDVGTTAPPRAHVSSRVLSQGRDTETEEAPAIHIGSRAVVLAQHIHTSRGEPTEHAQARVQWSLRSTYIHPARGVAACVHTHGRTRLTREASAEIWIFRHGKRPFGLAFIPPSRPGSGMQRMSNGQRSAPQRRSCDSLLGYASLPGVGMDAGFRSLSSRRSSREAARDWKRPC
jgi:hypothetical protein